MNYIFILGTVFVIFFLFLIGLISFLWRGKGRCEKCGEVVKTIDCYYYYKKFKNAPTRYRCSLHPIKGYKKTRVQRNHFKYEVSQLTDKQKLEIKNKEVQRIILQDFEFCKLVKCINPINKTVSLELKFNNKSLDVYDKKAGIYLIKRLSDGKPYVGQSKNISNRWNQHQHQDKVDGFHEKIKQNPLDFEYRVLINCPVETLDFFEAYFIKRYNSYNAGFNLTKGNYSHLSSEEKKLLKKTS